MQFKYRELFKGLDQYRAPHNYELAGQTLQVLLDDFGECTFDIQADRLLYFLQDRGIIQKICEKWTEKFILALYSDQMEDL